MLSSTIAPNTGVLSPSEVCTKEDGGNTHVYIYTFSLPRSAIHCPWINKVTVACNLRGSLKVTPFPRTMSTLSLILTTFIVVQHPRGGSVMLHLPDNHTPLLEHCASKKCNIQWADENDAERSSAFTDKAAVVQVIPSPLKAGWSFVRKWSESLFWCLNIICSLNGHSHLSKAIKRGQTFTYSSVLTCE